MELAALACLRLGRRREAATHFAIASRLMPDDLIESRPWLLAAWRQRVRDRASGGIGPSRSLVLVHTEGWQDVADFQVINAHVEHMAPDIEVSIASNITRSSYTRKKAASRPSLVFSPARLLNFRPNRGKVYAGQPMCTRRRNIRPRSGGIFTMRGDIPNVRCNWRIRWA